MGWREGRARARSAPRARAAAAPAAAPCWRPSPPPCRPRLLPSALTCLTAHTETRWPPGKVSGERGGAPLAGAAHPGRRPACGRQPDALPGARLPACTALPRPAAPACQSSDVAAGAACLPHSQCRRLGARPPRPALVPAAACRLRPACRRPTFPATPAHRAAACCRRQAWASGRPPQGCGTPMPAHSTGFERSQRTAPWTPPPTVSGLLAWGTPAQAWSQLGWRGAGGRGAHAALPHAAYLPSRPPAPTARLPPARAPGPTGPRVRSLQARLAGLAPDDPPGALPPVFVRPARPLGLPDVMSALRSHFDGTAADVYLQQRPATMLTGAPGEPWRPVAMLTTGIAHGGRAQGRPASGGRASWDSWRGWRRRWGTRRGVFHPAAAPQAQEGRTPRWKGGRCGDSGDAAPCPVLQ